VLDAGPQGGFGHTGLVADQHDLDVRMHLLPAGDGSRLKVCDRSRERLGDGEEGQHGQSA
jgi:hypothetical protein